MSGATSAPPQLPVAPDSGGTAYNTLQAVGATTAAYSHPVVLATDQGGQNTDAAVPDIGAAGAVFTFMALLKGLVVNTAATAAALRTLAAAEAPYQGVIPMQPGATVVACRALRVVASTAGNITVTYADGSTDTIPVNPGLSYISGAITMVTTPANGGASATFANMK